MERGQGILRLRPRVVSIAGDGEDPAAVIAARLGDMPAALILIFSAAGEVLQDLTGVLSERFGPGCRVVGCSSAGCFAFGGYRDDRIVCIAFPAATFRAEVLWMRHLRQHGVLDWMMGLRRLSDSFVAPPAWSRFGLLLIDGLSQREELVAATVDATLGPLPVVGGSTGDGLRFGRTHIAIDGESHEEAAVFCLLSSAFRVEEVIFDHFSPSAGHLVITAADPEERTILEINAEPAAEEYARLIGRDVAELGPESFAANSLLMRLGGRHVVRAIQSVTSSGHLSLMSSVEVGTAMTIGRPDAPTDGLEARLRALGETSMILGFDCVLRRVALERAGLGETVGRIYRDHRVVGFNTYGEQHGGLHVNQTFVGLAFLEPGRPHAATR